MKQENCDGIAHDYFGIGQNIVMVGTFSQSCAVILSFISYFSAFYPYFHFNNILLLISTLVVLRMWANKNHFTTNIAYNCSSEIKPFS